MYDYRELINKDRQYVWHPFTQMKSWNEEEPLIIVSGKGNLVIDVQGNEYIDAYSSLWCNVHGHNVPEINAAVKNQLDLIAHSTLLGAANVPSILLAEKLIQIAPEGLTKVFYSDSGATAVEIALKMAYQYWTHIEGKPRKSFITFQEAYHGDTVGSVSLGGMPLFHDIFKGLLFDTHKIPATSTLKQGKTISLEEAGSISLAQAEKVLKTNQGQVIAIVVEPLVFGAAGMIVQPEGFVKKLSLLALEYDTLLICDEVATGFGRTGEMFACNSEAVCPDIMTVAKGLTGGYLPVAATLTREKIFNAFLGEFTENKTFFHGHTYTGNQLGCAAALANLDLMEKNQTLTHVKRISALFASKLTKMAEQSPFIGEIRRKGLMTGIEIVQSKKNRVPFPAEKRAGHKIIMECRKHGVLTRNLGDVIVINPPLSITEMELDRILSALELSIDKIANIL